MKRVAALAVVLSALIGARGVRAERLGYPPEEFAGRRAALAKALGEGTLLLFGSTMPANGSRFRQDNDFYYFTGSEDAERRPPSMDASSGETRLFLPTQSESEVRSDGTNWLAQARTPPGSGDSRRCSRCRC